MLSCGPIHPSNNIYKVVGVLRHGCDEVESLWTILALLRLTCGLFEKDILIGHHRPHGIFFETKNRNWRYKKFQLLCFKPSILPKIWRIRLSPLELGVEKYKKFTPQQILIVVPTPSTTWETAGRFVVSTSYILHYYCWLLIQLQYNYVVHDEIEQDSAVHAQ